MQYETQYVRKDGTTARVPANPVALRDEHNMISDLTSTMTDVTEYRQADIAPRQAQEAPLDRQKRETERVETKLAQAREQLVRQTHLATIGQMSATIAYELRTPLGTIRNAVYLLKRRSSITQDGKGEQYLGIVEEEMNSANQIISDLMEMTLGKASRSLS